ncbi:MAG TPA: WD40 repeat domain-containing protein, partial [Gemmataceae bacterium]
LLAAAVAVGLGIGIAPEAPTSAQPEKGEPGPEARRADEPALTRIGASRFRAARRIGDARYSFDGKRIVGCAGSSLYVWDAADGSLLRTIDTKLGLLDDPTMHGEKWLAFAVHPKASRVACGGVRDGKTYLQVWDYETGKPVAEKASPCDALKALAWTPEGGRLLERASVGWEKPTAWKLIVRDGELREVRAHDLPEGFGEWSTVMLPLPGGERVILWQGRGEPTEINLESGEVVGTIPYKPQIPSDLALSPDGKLLAATSTTDMVLLNFPAGDTRRELPVLRDGWEKPRPLFSPDGRTVYVWDHRPIAYGVASGTEKWKATFRTAHTVRVALCDVSPDGTTGLARCGHALVRIGAKTGTERDPPDGPSAPPGVVWSPDGKLLFTRTGRHDRTWTAWEAASGKRLHDLIPTGFVADDDWKLMPDLFFIRGGKEIVAGLEKSESTERVGPKELLVFDTATGRCLRRLGEPLPDDPFRWMHPIAVDPTGTTVLMQKYTISALPGPAGAPAVIDRSREFTYKNLRWDPAKRVKLQEWDVTGHRTEPPRHYDPYYVTLGVTNPDPNRQEERPAPAKIRCYALANGRLVHERTTDFPGLQTDRVQGKFLLTAGYESKCVTRGNSMRYTPQPPVAYDLWELPGRDKVRVFETGALTTVALGPGGRYILRVLDDTTVEVHEPFVLKRAVAKVATPCRPELFEFSPGGDRLAVSLSDASVVIWDTTPWEKQLDAMLVQAVPVDLTPLWDDLAKDAATGLRAARLLSAAGDRAVALLGEKVAPQKPPEEARIKRWIADLDSPTFATREGAEKALREVSVHAESHLRAALETNPPAELRRRIGELLR